VALRYCVGRAPGDRANGKRTKCELRVNSPLLLGTCMGSDLAEVCKRVRTGQPKKHKNTAENTTSISNRIGFLAWAR